MKKRNYSVLDSSYVSVNAAVRCSVRDAVNDNVRKATIHPHTYYSRSAICSEADGAVFRRINDSVYMSLQDSVDKFVYDIVRPQAMSRHVNA
jgi:hypothetical protein